MNRLPSDSPAAASPVAAAPPSQPQAAPASAAPGRPDPRKRPTIVARPRSKKIWGATMKVIRRTHLYTGLLLLPWVLLFGFSGFVFNHGELFRPAQTQTVLNIAPADLQKDLGFNVVDASVVASQVVEQLNAQAEAQGGVTFKLNGSAELRGLLTLSAGGDDVRHTWTMNLNTGQATVTTVPTTGGPAQPETTTPPFAGQAVQVAALPVEGLSQRIDDLTYELGIDSDGNWAMRGRGGGPEVRFVMQDSDGRDWHVGYNVMRGTLSGRAADEAPSMNFAQTLSRLHRLHHYPTEFGMRWLWILMADITALTMVFWGISGAIMWWQLKPTRTIGIAGLSLAAVLGFVIIAGTLDDLNFGGTPQRGRVATPGNAPAPGNAPGGAPAPGRSAPGQNRGGNPEATPGQNRDGESPRGGRGGRGGGRAGGPSAQGATPDGSAQTQDPVTQAQVAGR